MKPLFFVPFATGSIYSFRKERKLPPSWGYPASILTTTSVLALFQHLASEPYFDGKSVKKMPGTFAGIYIVHGAFFCLGHLMTKMAYPLLQ